MAIDFDLTYIFILALFLVPLLLLNALIFSPFKALYAERHEKMEGSLDRAEAAVSEAADKEKAFDERMREATLEGVETRDRLRNEAQHTMSQRLDKERGFLKEKLESAMTDIGGAKDNALSTIEKQAEALGRQAAEKLLGGRIS